MLRNIHTPEKDYMSQVVLKNIFLIYDFIQFFPIAMNAGQNRDCAE